MTDTEREKLNAAIPLLQALADKPDAKWEAFVCGQFKAIDFTPTAVDIVRAPNLYRIAPDLPEKPPQWWLDRWGVDCTDECRCARKEDQAYCEQFSDSGPQTCLFPESGAWEKPMWILRKREPRYEPWTLETVPMPLVIRMAAMVYVAVACDENGATFCNIKTQGLVTTWYRTWADLLRDGKQIDWTPCGRLVES